MANCDNCAHCADLRAPNKNDPKELTALRDFEMATAKKWVGDYWKKTIS